ncbi:hypothetical protein EDD15DRAFT_2199997 [Pisolithus albus]|nr:hypothetical protein EDD15DRAFT_2199997 [Pisolithus albus]
MDGADYVDTAPRRRAPRGMHKKKIDALCIAWYPKDVQEVLKYARHVLVHEMILNTGWLHDQKACTAWNTGLRESLMQANAAFKTNVESTNEIETVMQNFCEILNNFTTTQQLYFIFHI